MLSQLSLPRVALAALAVGAGAGATAAPAAAENAIAVSSFAPQRVVQFDTASPSTLTSNVPVSGLRRKELIQAVDYRPASGQVLATTSQNRLVELDPVSGAVTAVDADDVPELAGATDAVGFDVNPTVDRLRYVNGQQKNLRIASGSTPQATVTTDSALQFATGDRFAGQDPQIGAEAYTTNVAGATSTELFGIDTARNVLVRQSPPNDGTLSTIGAIGVNTTSEAGFDISGATGTAFATLTPSSPRVSNLYLVNLTTGAATPVGAIGAGARYRSFAIVPARDANEIDVEVLFNNDPESRLRRFADTGTGANYGGAARHVALFKALANQASGSDALFRLNGGDNVLAGVDFQASLEKSPRAPFYDSVALGRIDFDALAIGNHEFDFGPDVFAEFIDGFADSTRFVSSNLDVSAEPNLQALAAAGQIVRRTVVSKDGRDYGVVGAILTDLPSISSPGDAVVSAVQPAVQAEIDALKGQGIERIFLVTQLNSIRNDRDLARELTGVDVIISGGGQETQADQGAAATNVGPVAGQLVPGDSRTAVIPGTASDVLDFPLTTRNQDGEPVKIVTTNGLYKYVGRLSVRFDPQGRITGHDEARSRPFRVSGNASDPDVIAEDAFTRDNVRVPLDAFVSTLSATVLGQQGVDLEGRRASLRTREVNEGNLVADALLFEGRRQAAAAGNPLPTISLQNSGGLRNDNLIPAGQFSRATAFSIAPFPNFLATVTMTPRQLKDALELGVGRHPAVDGRFPQVAGLRFTFDSTGVGANPSGSPSVPISAGTRIREVWLEDGFVGPSAGDVKIVDAGTVLSGGPVPASIVMVTNDFTARGGDDYPLGSLPRRFYSATYEQALEAFVTTPVVDGGLARAGDDITAAEYPLAGQGRITRIP
jgi:2',3'-cyclic-nucleotide 2'-phosphodiesterase (5'-nucleotidase family)